jgi:uroporphyrinogen-III synthase
MEQASAVGIHIDNIDFIRTEPLLSREKAAALNKLPEADFVFTSTNAAEALHKLLQQFPNPFPSSNVYCMAGRTAGKVKILFPELTVRATGNKAAELAEKIIADGSKEVIFFSGNLRRDELPVLLREKGIQVNELEIYKTYHTPVHVDDQYNGILFFSPSAAESFFSINQINQNAICFAIGDTTAAALRQYTNNRIMAAVNPRQENMIAMVIEHFKNR